MYRLISLSLFIVLNTVIAFAQGSVKGRVLDKKTNMGLEFINVVVRKEGDTKIYKGSISDMEGNFIVDGLPNGAYTLTATFLGYKDLERKFTVSASKPDHNFIALYMTEDTKALDEVVVTAQRSEMKLEVDRKTFNVDQQIANAGGAASDVLENIPSVEVDNDGQVSLRGNTSVEVWINGKASGLTSDNRAEILQQLPAESIEKIEVIDNPSAKFSAEGSAGIINIVLKKNRKAGYYGSVQAGADTRGGANSSVNVNYNSSLIDAYVNVGYRHRKNEGGAWSRQTYTNSNTYQNYESVNRSQGNNLFTRAGLTLHATDKDDITLGGMFMLGKRNTDNNTPYHYGSIGAPFDSRVMYRHTMGGGEMRMMHADLGYRHNFSDKHFIDFNASYDRWKPNHEDIYQDSTAYFDANGEPVYSSTPSASYQFRPMRVNSRSMELKLDYENQITNAFKLQAGYQGNFSKENTPQESFVDNTSWYGTNLVEDKDYYNRFIYKNNIHAFYTTATYNAGKFGLMAGLRGEYWKVNTESYSWAQERDATLRGKPFKKDYFQLFPSVFMSYQLTDNDQLQLNYTRRLRRPWGGQLNSFRNTSDATVISYGNPELTPEYSNSFSLNYLRTWTQHSLLVSAYYRPTSDVMERITYRSSADGLMYQTNFNVAKSTSTGLELTAKNKLFRILDLSSSANFYYYKLDGFSFDIDGQTITGAGNSNFTWNARVQASLMLPYDISVQATGNFRSRQTITQGYRKSNGSIDLGLRKSFLNRTLVLSVNCRDLLNSRRWKTYTSSDSFTRQQESWRSGRHVRITLTWNFGNMKKKRDRDRGNDQEEDYGMDSYNGGGEM
ncbi:TonB-dependent receptor domain-containing protein [Prevotella sp. HUN102]|uniref:TonB-dependent receptor domain-containing protein n=1 Tax=Prevotella sp. HUN102 TaxID=1392486 RepID=UPI00048DE610|nr:TonB-dependent receptor [Prevotella sp. HUN102]